MDFLFGDASVWPQVKMSDDRLTATTDLWLQVITLGCLYRKVCVDVPTREVTIVRRYFWKFRKRTCISFRSIKAITYGYEDLRAPVSYFSATHDGEDHFSVGLKLLDDSEIPLFDFHGNGSFTNDSALPDWIFPGYWLDFSGHQERRSREFVDALSSMIDVTVVPPARI